MRGQVNPAPCVGSTRVVRFSGGKNEPNDMATGPQDAEFEPLGAEGNMSNGGRRASGLLGAAVRALESVFS